MILRSFLNDDLSQVNSQYICLHNIVQTGIECYDDYQMNQNSLIKYTFAMMFSINN